MIRFSLRKGLRFIEGEQAWTLLRKTPFGKFQLESDQGELLNLSLKDIHKKWASSHWRLDLDSLGQADNIFYLTTPKDFSSLSDRQKTIAARRHKYLLRVRELLAERGLKPTSSPDVLRPILNAVALEQGDTKPPCPTTFGVWSQRFELTKCVTALIDRRDRAGRRREARSRDLFESTVLAVYLNEQRHAKLAVHTALQENIKAANRACSQQEQIPIPSRATVYRWLDDLQLDLEIKARLGKRAFEKHLKAAFVGVKVDRILERVEIDHTPVNVIVVDRSIRKILGRPYLTLVLDVKTRSILGFYMSFHGPSAQSVLHALKCAILPKAPMLSGFPSVKGQWLCHGIMDRVVVDNGAELHSEDVEAALLDLGIDIVYCGVARPELKAKIERLMRTIAESVFHILPGTTFSSPVDRGDYPSEEHACIDIAMLTELVLKWIVDIYQNSPHKGLDGKTPNQAWEEAAKDAVIELPVSVDALEISVGLSCMRTLFHYGIELDNLLYNSPELQQIRQQLRDKKKLKVKYFEDDVGYVSVHDPFTDEYLRVPCSKPEYANGLSRYVHRLIVEEIRKRYNENLNAEVLLSAKAEMSALVQQMEKSAKKAERKRGAIAKLEDSATILEQGPDVETKGPRAPIKTAMVIKAAEAELDPGLEDDLPPVFIEKRNFEGGVWTR